MQQENLHLELGELKTYLRLVGVAIDKGHLGAAEAYLEDIECGINELRELVERLASVKLIEANLLVRRAS